ncbi:uncharacterized protein Aud_009288 [Aspergillus udagawae]|uniref:Fucose-specific lectin n=1 Tax=Aspergillus udagawae TaxID=91492 RepID=A0A8E0V3W9_9EURO|nr:uncharacterized protein Aud_009288 [Aspergillus udagawae]GIC92815.1 hypothetical protein Aud_009288 [Aspergillus udagawae]
MATAASLDSVEFFLGGNRNLRVYYQFGDDNTLRESCFAQDYGWFIRGNGIIAKDAKRNSPVTATRWTDNPGTTQIRVYYVDDAHDIREVRFDSSEQNWSVQDNPITLDAITGTRLSAVSDKAKQAVRLYYQGNDYRLREMYCDENYTWGHNSTIIRRKPPLVRNAPISAVSWRNDNGELQIRVFSVHSAERNAVSQFSYRFPNWQGPFDLKVPYKLDSGIATCRNTGTNTTAQSPISVFYQNGPRIIDLAPIPADETPLGKQMASGIQGPAGIPISRGGETEKEQEAQIPLEAQSDAQLDVQPDVQPDAHQPGHDSRNEAQEANAAWSEFNIIDYGTYSLYVGPPDLARVSPGTISFSPSGKLLAIGDSDSPCTRIWDVQRATELKCSTYTGNTAFVRSVTFAPDSEDKVWVGRWQGAFFWEWPSKDNIEDAQLRDNSSWADILTPSPDGRYLLANDVLWYMSPPTPAKLGTFPSGTALAFSQDSSLVATIYKNSVNIFDAASLKLLKTLKGHSGEVTTVEFLDRRDMIVTGSRDYTIRLWDWTNEKLKGVQFHQAEVTWVAVSRNGKWVASGSRDGILKLWDGALARECDSTLLAAVCSRQVKIWKIGS